MTAWRPGVPKNLEQKGFFYLIQPIPEYNPNRIKLGFTSSLEDRLVSHKVTCPNAKILRAWVYVRKMEKTAIKEIAASVEHTELTSELFEVKDLDKLLRVAEKYFGTIRRKPGQLTGLS